jgi:hypothetical protein
MAGALKCQSCCVLWGHSPSYAPQSLSLVSRRVYATTLDRISLKIAIPCIESRIGSKRARAKESGPVSAPPSSAAEKGFFSTSIFVVPLDFSFSFSLSAQGEKFHRGQGCEGAVLTSQQPLPLEQMTQKKKLLSLVPAVFSRLFFLRAAKLDVKD